jgi:hypothetical protein
MTRTVSALYSKHIQGIFLACNSKQRGKLLTVEPKKKRHIMLLKRCRGSAWLKALVSSVCNLPLRRFSSEICSPQQSIDPNSVNQQWNRSEEPRIEH